MTWTRLSDDFADRPELLECSRSARLLHVEALIYCNRQLTDGRIPAVALSRFSDSECVDAEIEELIAAGVWERIHSRALQIVDWSGREHQESAEDVHKRQAASQEKQKRYRDRVRRHGERDHAICDPRGCAGRRKHDADDHALCWEACSSTVTGNATSNETSDETDVKTRRVTPSPPIPALPLPKGQGQGKAPRRCEHGKPLASDGAACDECAEHRPVAVAS